MAREEVREEESSRFAFSEFYIQKFAEGKVRPKQIVPCYPKFSGHVIELSFFSTEINIALGGDLDFPC